MAVEILAVFAGSHAPAWEPVQTLQGRERSQARLLSLLIQQRFGLSAAAADARLQAATPAQLEAWGVRLLTATRLEDVFGQGQEPVRKLH